MGNTQSNLGATECTVIDENIRIIAGQPATTSTEQGHSRLLPPPQSRSEVLATLQRLSTASNAFQPTSSVSPLGSNGDSGTQEDEPQADTARVMTHISRFTAQPNTMLDTTPKHRADVKPAFDGLQPKKKRRLFLSDKAAEKAQEISEESLHRDRRKANSDTLQSDKLSTAPLEDVDIIGSLDALAPGGNHADHEPEDTNTLKRRGPFAENDSEDEGYYTWSPTSAESSFDEEDDKSLVKELARLHQRSVVSRPGSDDAQIPTPPDSPLHRKIQEENEAAEQSRLLRERKHSGQQVRIGFRNSPELQGSFSDDDSIFGDHKVRQSSAANSLGANDRLNARTRGPGSTTRPQKLHEAASLRAPIRKRVHPSLQSTSDSEDSNIDDLLDVAQAYATKRTALPKSRLRRINPRTPQYRRFPSRPSPYSRQAAEQYRTQTRHIQPPAASHPVDSSTATSLEEREARLHALTSKTHEDTSVNQSLPSFGRRSLPSPTIRKGQKFYGIDLNQDRAANRTRLLSPDLPRSGYSSQINDAEIGFESLSPLPNSKTPDETERPRDGSPGRPLSLLEMMARKAQRSQLPPEPRTQQKNAPDIELGVMADIDHEDEEQVRNEHERLKEQQKDLEAIETTCMAIASIRALGPLNTLEAKEEHEIRKFVGIVLDARRPGKDRRGRMISIRGNFGKRLEREDFVPNEDRVQEEYIKLLGEKRVKLLSDLREPVDDIVAELGSKRRQLMSKRNSRNKSDRQKKQVRFTDAVTDKSTGRLRRDIPDGTAIDLDDPAPKKKVRAAGKEEQEMAKLKAKLRLLETQSAARSTDGPPVQQQQHPGDLESEVSEEDDGAEYVFGAGRNLSAKSDFTAPTRFPRQAARQTVEFEQDLKEINRLDEERQRQERTLPASQDQSSKPGLSSTRLGFQRPDLELMEQMRAKQNAGAVVTQTRTEDLPFDDLAELSDSDASVASAATASSLASSSADDGPQIVESHKYTVMAQFVGIEIYHPEEQYILKSFHDLSLANEYVKKVISSVAADHRTVGRQRGQLLTAWDEQGLDEQVLYLGRDDDVQSKVWVEKEVVNVDSSRIRARRARKAILAETKATWVVDWEKTVTPILTVEEAAGGNGGNNAASASCPITIDDDGEDDLFGRSPCPPAPSPPVPPITSAPSTTTAPAPAPTHSPNPIITRPSPEEIFANMFTTPALANRRAKEIYIEWFAKFCPEHERPYHNRLTAAIRSEITYGTSRYEGMLGQVDLGLERELERLGGRGGGPWENEFEVKGGGGGGEERGRSRKEKLTVWVRRVGVLGPQN